MAISILDIIIRTSKEGGADKEVVGALVNIQSSAANAMATFAAFAVVGAALDQVYKNTVDVFVQYADQVRNVQFVTGATAEESSKLIQVADDAKISYEELARAMQFASKQGITPNIEGLAKLSDQYNSLAPGQERENFLLKEFGKNGGALAELMSKGAAGVRLMGDAIEANLILTQKSVDEARVYEQRLDSLSDAVQGLKVKYGSEFLPVLSDAIEMWLLHNETLAHTADVIAATEDPANRMTRAIGETAKALQGMTVSEKATAEAAKILSDELKSQISVVKSIQNENDSYADSMRKARGNVEQLGLELQDVTKKYGPHSQAVEEATKKYGDAKQAVLDLQTAHHKAMASILLDLLLVKLSVGGLTQAEEDQYFAAGEALGVLGKGALKQEQMFTKLNQLYADGTITLDQFGTAAQGVLDGTITETYQLQAVLDATIYDRTMTITTVYDDEYTTGGAPGPGYVPPRYASGGDFIVPAGFPNDSYPMQVQSGEHVKVTRAGQPGNQQGGSTDNSKRTQIFGPVTIHVQNGQTIDDVLNQLR